jgi:hypothetical protein
MLVRIELLKLNNRNMNKKILFSIVALLIIAFFSIFRPVPIVAESEAIVEKGIVFDIYEGGVKDVAFRLENNQRVYYINRGLERGLNLKNLKNKLIGNEVVIKYPKYWTPLDWNNKIQHISKVEIKGEVIFNELKK